MTALPGSFPCTGVGSLPHLDPRAAVALVLTRFREIPYWPQLPRRTPLEHMYPQYAAALPGASVVGDRLTMRSGEALLPDAEAFYETFLSGDLSPFAVPEERAAGLHALLAAGVGPFPAVKGQVTGPVSFGLMVCDREKKPVFYDPVGRDVLVKYLLRVAQWQASQLRRLSGTVILTLDEPYLASVGSAIVSLPREEVIAALDEIFDGLSGVLCGIHCCANTDWGLVLASKSAISPSTPTSTPTPSSSTPKRSPRSSPAAACSPSGSSQPRARRSQPRRRNPSPPGWRGFSTGTPPGGSHGKRWSVPSVITPACGLGTLPEEAAERALRLTVELSGLRPDTVRGGLPVTLRIAVAGKGGVGKTTCSALLLRALALSGVRPLLAVDADPNANLHQLLSLPLPEGLGSLREEQRAAGAARFPSRTGSRSGSSGGCPRGKRSTSSRWGAARGRDATAT